MRRRSDGRRLTRPGDAEPVCGRKFCSLCGRWRLLCDFSAQRSATGELLAWRSACQPCARARQREAQRRHRQQRLEEGITIEPLTNDRVDAGPFLDWLDHWAVARCADAKAHCDPGPVEALSSIEALARAAEMDARSFRRVRENGRVSLGLVDRVLIAAGGNTMLWELYDYDELDKVAA